MAARVLARVNTLFRGQGRAIPAILPCAPGVTRGYATYDGSRLTSMAVGDSISVTRTFTEDDVQAFADLSGDHNPLHLDKEYAKKTRFGRPIVHGVLINRYVAAIFRLRISYVTMSCA